jgi:flavin reductase (DIM6/NTAB) family NADH-FMN oxidoreductase RutF
MFARLLYPNPVCLLSVKEEGRRNAMVISWLTAIDNKGAFFCSINLKRHTAGFVRDGSVFVLNPAVHGMEELLLKVGGSTGDQIDKFQEFDIQTCSPGWEVESQPPLAPKTKAKHKPSAKELKERAVVEAANCSVAIADGVAAHLLCQVHSTQPFNGHQMTVCQVLAAWVRPTYWMSGKTFVASAPSPPLLGFLGSKQFVCMREPDSPEVEGSPEVEAGSSTGGGGQAHDA